MIKSSDLTNRELGGTAGMNGQAKRQRATPGDEVGEIVQELGEQLEEVKRQLEERLARARLLNPPLTAKHCLDCFQKGRDAAIRVMSGDDP